MSWRDTPKRVGWPAKQQTAQRRWHLHRDDRPMGYTEWVLPEGHTGDHMDEEGVTWPEEDAIY
jgi:hypothetical protein